MNRFWLTLGLIVFLSFSGWHIILAAQTARLRLELEEMRIDQSQGYYAVIAESVPKKGHHERTIILERLPSH